MERDVVVVTINYRLGAFGFLALEVEEVSGNAGLKVNFISFFFVKNSGNFLF